MEPKFKLGEEVILQHKTHPHLNGEYVVLSMIDKDTFNESHKGWYCNGNYGYNIGVVLNHSSGNGSTSKYVGENNLRKKHLPSSESFDKLMSWLKQPQRV